MIPTSRSRSRRTFRLHAPQPKKVRTTSLVQVCAILWMALCFSPHDAALAGGSEIRASAAERRAKFESRKSQVVIEYKIKAAFLYNFIRYTTWPKGSLGKKSDPIELVVVGKNPFDKALDAAFAGKTLHGRKVRIQYLSKLPKNMTAHVVFATGQSTAEEDRLIKRLRGQPTLLVGDREGLARRGSSANFYIEKSKVRFEVNSGEVKNSGLEISSQLLKLASIVKTKGVPK